MKTGASIGWVGGFAAGAAIVGLNLIGFPEVELAEGGAAALGGWSMAL